MLPLNTGTTSMSYANPSTFDGPDTPMRHSGISWGAILAGGVIAAAIAAALNILGAGLGFASVDAVAHDSPTAGGFGMAAVAWMVVSNSLALGVGGYAAARLSGTSSDTDGVLHGLAVWAVAFLVSAVMLGNLAAGAASTAVSAAGNAVGGAASAVGQVSAQAMPDVNPAALIERAQNTLRGAGGPPAAMTSEQRTAETATILGRRVTQGSFSADDRTRLNALVAAEANIQPDEAARRIQAVEAEGQRIAAETEVRARQAADTAAQVASRAAFAGFAALLIGALAAVIGARTGTRSKLRTRGTVGNPREV